MKYQTILLMMRKIEACISLYDFMESPVKIKIDLLKGDKIGELIL